MNPLALQFEIHPSSGVPIYRQIMDQVQALIASGRLRPGDLVPSIRQLATDLEVNMMTVSKAYTRLEADGVLERVRGTGMRVRATTPTMSMAQRYAELQPLADALVTRAMQLGLSEKQIQALLQKSLRERHTWLKRSSKQLG